MCPNAYILKTYQCQDKKNANAEIIEKQSGQSLLYGILWIQAD